jgi:hypothetical protein
MPSSMSGQIWTLAFARRASPRLGGVLMVPTWLGQNNDDGSDQRGRLMPPTGPRDENRPALHLSGAAGVQVGRGNFQVNNFYKEQTSDSAPSFRLKRSGIPGFKILLYRGGDLSDDNKVGFVSLRVRGNAFFPDRRGNWPACKAGALRCPGCTE